MDLDQNSSEVAHHHQLVEVPHRLQLRFRLPEVDSTKKQPHWLMMMMQHSVNWVIEQELVSVPAVTVSPLLLALFEFRFTNRRELWCTLAG